MNTALTDTDDVVWQPPEKPARNGNGNGKKKQKHTNLCGDCFAEFIDPDIQHAADKLRDHKAVCPGPRFDASGKLRY